MRFVDSGHRIANKSRRENRCSCLRPKGRFILEKSVLTKEQKRKSVARGEALLEKNQHVLFADFTGVSTLQLQKMRGLMRELGGTFSVIKKRLIRIALKNKGIDFDPTRFDAQAGMIAIPGDIYGAAGKIHALVKELAKAKAIVKILGGVAIADKKKISAEEFLLIAKLPSREALLTQIAFMLTMPIKKVMIALGEQAKKSA